MNPSIKVKSSTNIDFDHENDKKDPKFEVDNHVRISKCKILHYKLIWRSLCH